MKEITTNELLTLTQQFVGKKVEVGLQQPYSTNTYSQFSICKNEEEIVMYDLNRKTPHELRINIETISRILHSEGENFFQTSFSIFLNNETSIDFCVDEERITCCKCGKVINLDPFATAWNISGQGNYGSHFDNQKLNMYICDDCLYHDVLGYIH
jgi:hypothetical protein